MFATKLKLVTLAIAPFSLLAAGALALAHAQQANWPPAADGEAKPATRAAEPQGAAPARGSAKSAGAAGTIMEQRVATAREIYRVSLLLFQQGNHSSDDILGLIEWSRHWMEDEVRIGDGPAGRLAARQAHLDRMKDLESQVKAMYRRGELTLSESLKAKYYRLEAEQLLEEEKASQPGGEPKK